MSGFLSKLFGRGGNSDAEPAGEPEVYKGYIIEPRPKGGGGTYNVAGAIRKQGEANGPVHEFIRADTFTSVEDAVRFSIVKAKQIIDERGDKMFTGGGW